MAMSSLLLIAEARLLKEEALNDGKAGGKQFPPPAGFSGFPGIPFPPFPFPFPFTLPPFPRVPLPPFIPPFPGVQAPPVSIPILPPSPPSLPPPTQA